MGNMAVLLLEVAVRPCLFDPVPFFIILYHLCSFPGVFRGEHGASDYV